MKTLLPLFLFSAAFVSQAAHASRLGESPNSVAMFVTEVVGTDGVPHVSSKVGPLVFDGQRYGISKHTAVKTDAQDLVGFISPFVPKKVPVTFGYCKGQLTDPSNSQVIQQATSYLTSSYAYGPLKSKLVEHMKTYGIPQVVFQYEQSVKVGTGLSAATGGTSGSSGGTSSGSGTSSGGSGGGLGGIINNVQNQAQQQVALQQYYSNDGSPDYGYGSGSTTADTSGSYINGASTEGTPDYGYGSGSTSVSGSGYGSTYCDPSLFATQTRTLRWTFTLDQLGKLTYGPVDTSSDALTSVHATYFSKAVTPGLSQSFGYPDGGYLKMYQVDKLGATIGQTFSYDTGGAYDAVVAAGEDETSDAATLVAAQCVANNKSVGCTTAQTQYPDVMSLIDSTGATMGVLDYIKSVAPVYVQVGTSSDGSSADTIMDWYLYEQSRTLVYPQCGYAVYSNQGYYQIRLQATANRYMVSSKGDIALVSTASSNYLQDPTSFSLQALLAPESASSQAAAILLNPMSDSASTLQISSTPGIKQLADITVQGSPPSSMYYAIDANNNCDVANRRVINTSCPTGYTIGGTDGSHTCTATGTAGTLPNSFTCPDGSISTTSSCTATPIVQAYAW